MILKLRNYETKEVVEIKAGYFSTLYSIFSNVDRTKWNVVTYDNENKIVVFSGFNDMTVGEMLNGAVYYPGVTQDDLEDYNYRVEDGLIILND